MELFRRFDTVMGRLYDGVGLLAGVVIGMFAVAISLDLGLRYFGVGNLAGMQEIIEYALFALVFLAAPWVLRLGAHVRVDVVLSALPDYAARRLDWCLDLFGFVISVVLGWYGWVNLSQAYRFQSVQMKYFQVPEWWLLTVFVVAFALLALEFLCRLVRSRD